MYMKFNAKKKNLLYHTIYIEIISIFFCHCHTSFIPLHGIRTRQHFSFIFFSASSKTIVMYRHWQRPWTLLKLDSDKRQDIYIKKKQQYIERRKLKLAHHSWDLIPLNIQLFSYTWFFARKYATIKQWNPCQMEVNSGVSTFPFPYTHTREKKIFFY